MDNLDSRCIDEDGDPCRNHTICGGNKYGWLGCTEVEKVAEAPRPDDSLGSGEFAGYDNLSDEAKETLKGMVEYCINHEYCMGMDGGYDENDAKREFRVQLEKFCAS